MQIHLHLRDKIYNFKDLFKEEQHPRSKLGEHPGQFVKKGQEGSTGSTSAKAKEPAKAKEVDPEGTPSSSPVPTESKVNKKYRIPKQKTEFEEKRDRIKAEKAELERKIKENQENKVRDDRRLKTHAQVNEIVLKPGGAAKEWISAGSIKDVAYKVADYLDFADQHNISTTEDEYKFTLNGRECRAGGTFSRDTKDIVFYTKAIENNPKFIGGLAAHEITHAKWQDLFEAYMAERELINKEKQNLKPGEDYWEVVLEHDGTLREPYKEKYPLVAALQPLINDTDAFVKDDGITDYSREWWKAYENHTADVTKAVHETFAEMGMLDYEGSLQRLLWFKNSKVYKPIYDIMNAYHAAKKKKYDTETDQFYKEAFGS